MGHPTYMRHTSKLASVLSQNIHVQDTTYNVTWLPLFVPLIFCLYCWSMTKTCHAYYWEWPEPVDRYNIIHKYGHEIFFWSCIVKGCRLISLLQLSSSYSSSSSFSCAWERRVSIMHNTCMKLRVSFPQILCMWCTFWQWRVPNTYLLTNKEYS